MKQQLHRSRFFLLAHAEVTAAVRLLWCRSMKEEAAIFAAAVMGSRLCLRCASIRSDIVQHRLVSVIQHVQRVLTVTETVDDCDNCQRRTIVYRLR